MIWLLPVTWDDSADLLRWRNDPVTCANSRSNKPVSQEDHDAWMTACMSPSRPKGWVWVADLDGISVGVVRVDLCVVSITVAPEHRGRGHAKEILRQLCEKFKDCWLNAEIKESNTESRYIFEVNDFRMISSDGEFMLYRKEP